MRKKGWEFVSDRNLRQFERLLAVSQARKWELGQD